MAIQFLNTVAVDTNVLYVDTSSDRVGIGTTLPGGLLHVSSGTSGDAVVIIESDTDNSNENDNPHVELRQDGGGVKAKLGIEGNAGNTYSNSVANATYLGTVFEQPLQFITGNTGGVQTAKMTIQPNNGNVGIGTTSPSEKLDVNGRVRIGDINYAYGGNNYHVLLAEDSNDAYISNINGNATISGGGYYYGSNLRLLNSTSTSYSGIQARADGAITFENATGGTAGSTIAVSEKMRINGSGNVGIGTTNPGTFKLDVAGSARSNFFALRLNQSLPSESSAIYRPATGTFAIVTSAAERMRIDSSGDVGIGTTDPNQLLHIASTSAQSVITLQRTNPTTTGAFGALQWTAIDNHTVASMVALGDGNDEGAHITFNTTSAASSDNPYGISERMRIDSSGKVGIGTGANVDEKLHIQGSVDNDDIALKIENNFDNNSSANPPSAAVLFQTASNNGHIRVFGAPADTAANHRMDIGATASTSYLTFSPSNTEKMRISSNGNVGIGTTAPSEKLEVVGNAVLDNSNAKLKIKAGATGTVGSIDFTFNTESTQYGLIDLNYDSRASQGFRIKSLYPMTLDAVTAQKFLISGSQKMVIDSGGKVGIGVTNPAAKLHVLNTGLAAIFQGGGFGSNIALFKNSTGNTEIVINDNGYIGVQRTTANYPIDVTGDISLSLRLRLGSYGAFLSSYYGVVTTNGEFRVGYGANNGSYAVCRASAFTVTSDYRLKENIEPLKNPIDRLKQLKVYRFNWKDKLDEDKVDGFIAHEVSDVIPEAVAGEKDEINQDGEPEHQGLDQAKIVPLLTSALQEAILKIEQLETRIQTLENN